MKILIIGANEITTELARRLARKGHSIVLVGRDPSICEKVAHISDVSVLVGDYTNLDFYESQGIDFKNMDIVVVITGSDEVNLMLSIIAKNLGAERVITLVGDEKIRTILTRLGIECLGFTNTVVALVETQIEGRHGVTDLVESLSADFRLVAIPIEEGDSCVGKKLGEIPLPPRTKMLAVFDGEKFLDVSKDLVLREGYIILALVHRDSLRELREVLK